MTLHWPPVKRQCCNMLVGWKTVGSTFRIEPEWPMCDDHGTMSVRCVSDETVHLLADRATEVTEETSENALF